jgi:hypothetical protein
MGTTKSLNVARDEALNSDLAAAEPCGHDALQLLALKRGDGAGPARVAYLLSSV